MGTFIPNTKEEQLNMLKDLGYKDFDDLFKDIPQKARLNKPLNLPKGKSELEVYDDLNSLASKNHVFKKIFRGAGAYNHYVPATVNLMASKQEFLTAYTPYQAEISQGVLQSIFEYQTMICELTGMDISNASCYDGASAVAEAANMCKERKKSNIYISETVDKRIKSVVETYSFGRNAKVISVPMKDGETDLDALNDLLAKDEAASCFIMQYPNFYGIIENADKISNIVHENGAKLVASVNPISLGILKTPGEFGADVVAGEGQPLGLGLCYGGPYLGILATADKNMRKIVGRVVGQTVDSTGERGFVLTLQAREQHIRREKASSNICSNEALCAFKAGVYLATLGPDGIKEVATLSTSKARYLADEFNKIGLPLAYDKPFFNEFVTKVKNPEKLLSHLEDNNILGGLQIDDDKILWCTTELNKKEDMDELVVLAKEVI